MFGFEFSAANSIFLVFICGLYSISIIKKFERGIVSNPKKQFIISYLIFLILPLIIILVHSIFSIKCPLLEGFSFYFVITLPSILIGTALGFLSSYIVKKFRFLLFVFLFLIILILPLYEFYFNPQVYFYNPIFGYFPGTIYDEALAVNSKLVIYRLLNVIYFGGIIIVLAKTIFSNLRLFKTYFIGLVLAIGFLFFYFSPLFGFSTNIQSIKKYLNKEIITEHFDIYYPGTIDKKLIDCIAVYHEFYYNELTNFFDIDPNTKFTSFLFLNSEQKKELFGSANADIAKPWLHQTYIDYDDYLYTLKHELAHCFAGFFSKNVFRIAENFNPYLTEGIAVAADPIFDENDVDYLAAQAYRNNLKPNFNNFSDPISFFTQASTISYVYAGSFTKYLVERYGITKFKKLYSNINFENVYHKSLKKLGDDYFSHLDSLKIDVNPNRTYYYFGRKSIFYKACPRYIANQLEYAWDDYDLKKYEKAKGRFSNIFSLSNNYSALVGLAYCDFNLNDKDGAVNLLKSKINDYKKSAYYYRIELSLGDLLAKENKFNEADTNYINLINQNPSYFYLNISILRYSIVQKDTLLKEYLNGGEKVKFKILQNLNKTKLNYSSIPAYIDLSKNLNVDFNIFEQTFKKKFTVNDFESSYAAYKLSNYFSEQLDFSNAVKFASLALRYDKDPNFLQILEENFKASYWIYKNNESIINSLKYN